MDWLDDVHVLDGILEEANRCAHCGGQANEFICGECSMVYCRCGKQCTCEED